MIDCSTLSVRIFAMAITSLSATAQAIGWVQTLPSSSPPNRNNHAMAYDMARQRVVLFGGWANRSDTWEWDGVNWQQRTPATSPPGRYAHAMAYDEARQRVVVFGGLIWSNYLNDTWEWDGANWLLRTPAVSPSPRGYHRMVYDGARQAIVLFGGSNNPASGATTLDDTWQWDGSNWVQLFPVTSPPPRAVNGMVYDPARQCIVVFGGATGTMDLDDTWEWDGVDWIPRPSNHRPATRQAHAMAYDAHRQKVVLFGGAGIQAPSPGYFSDTWEWDGNDWMQQVQQAGPPARWLSWMTYDSAHANLVLFAGHDGQDMGDTWIMGQAASYEPFGTGCVGPYGAVPSLAPVAGGVPRIGTTSQLRVSNLPSVVCVPIYAFGFSDSADSGPGGSYSLPLDLGILGWIGCQQFVSLEILEYEITTTGAVDHALTLPYEPAWVGINFYVQSVVLYHPTGVAVTNGIAGVIGY